ncbi:MAG TPA: TonB-dependent receptor [Polyangia bacterium]|jgi:hypothetical protein
MTLAPALWMATAWLGLAADGRTLDAEAAEPPDAGTMNDGVGETTPPTPVDGAATAAPVPRPLPPLPPPPPMGHLEGQIFGLGTRTPIAGVVLRIGLDEVATSDESGRFHLDLPCGPHHLTAQEPLFEALSVDRDPCVDVSPLIVRLAPRGGSEFQTVVRTPTSQAVVRLRGDELVHTAGALGDPLRVIESLPGVSSVMWPAPIYAVRGGNPGNTGFFLDDLPIPSLFHFALGPSVIHPYFFDSLDFFPGGYPARYGRYVAGAVVARTRAAPSDDVHASVDVRLFDAGALVSAPLPGNGAVVAAARYSYTGALVSRFSSVQQLDYWDYQLRADRNVGPVRLTVLAFGSNDVLVPGGDDGADRSVRLRFHRVKLRADLALGAGRLAASVGVGSDHTQAALAERFPVVLDSVSVLPRLAYTRPTRHADFEVGFDGQFQHFDAQSTVQRVDAIDLADARDATMLAGYASAAVRAGDRLLITPELRLDSYRIRSAAADTHKADLGPRLSARLALTPQTSLTAAGGRFTQTPSLAVQIPGAESFGLALLGLQSSWQGSLGVTTTGLWGLEMGLTGYLQRYVLSDIRDSSVLTGADPLAPDYLVRRDALSYGLELIVRRPATEKLYGWVAYTLSNNLRAIGGGTVAPSDWDQRHVLNVVAGYQLGRYTLGGRLHYNTGRPVLVSNALGEDFVRLPAFYEVDLRCDRRLLYDKFRLDVYVELVNATLNRQVVGLKQDALNGPLHQDGFSIVLPSVGVHGEF